MVVVARYFWDMISVTFVRFTLLYATVRRWHLIKCGPADCATSKMRCKLENGRLSDRYRIGTDTGCIVSNRIGYCCIGWYYVHQCRFINCWRIALHTMIKGRSSAPSPARRARTRACCFMVHDMGKRWRGGRRKETVTWYRHPRDKDQAVLVLATITPHSLHQQEVITTVSCQSL